MVGKVTPLPIDAVSHGGELGNGKSGRRSRVFKAISDVYEFHGWSRIWLAALWFVFATLTVNYRYPQVAGTYHSAVKALMTSYDLADGSTADVRSQSTFYGGLQHALGFLAAYNGKAEAAGQPEGSLPITEYDRILFARLEVDFKSNCAKEYKKVALSCYRAGLHPGTGEELDPGTLKALAGPDGVRKIVLLDPNVTRAELRERVQQVLDADLLFISTYGFKASLQIGVANQLAPHSMTVYVFTVSRKTNAAGGTQSVRSVVTTIDNVLVRSTPMYIAEDDYRRAAVEIISLLFLLKALWDEVVQFNKVRAWRNLLVTEDDRRACGGGWRRELHLTYFFISEPWNFLDLVVLLNFVIWWIVYAVVLARAYRTEVSSVRSTSDYDAARPFADLEVQHLVWGIFSSLLVGLRVLPLFKTQAGLSVYSRTLQLSGQRLKDLTFFLGYVYFLMVVLIEPIFEITGANRLFTDSGAGILNVTLLTFQYMGFQDYFAEGAPTFGAYWLIFMFFFWVVVLISVVISQNVLLALVASAYEEAREEVGPAEFTHIKLSFYRLTWIVYSRWHRWLLRKSPYDLAEHLLAATSRPDVWHVQHIFCRWALADLPETQLLAVLYTDPASEILYLYSPWAWYRASPFDQAQQAPWDEQLNYPLYGWEEVPRNDPGLRPRLRRLPPLFTRCAPDGRSVARGRLPVSYSEADDLFALSEEEVDELLECVEWCWGRMRRYPLGSTLAGLGWSERGGRLLREGLLEAYRRHPIRELTTTTVGDNDAASAGGGALIALEEPSLTSPAAKAAAGNGPGAASPNAAAAVGGGDHADDAGDAAAAALRRSRHFTLFNRHGRVAENLDLLWGEVSELRQQQSEIKALLQQLLLNQQQQMTTTASTTTYCQRGGHGGGVPPGGAPGGGGGMRGAATLPAERPPSGLSRSRGPWGD